MAKTRLNVILKERVELCEKSVEWRRTLFESCFQIDLQANLLLKDDGGSSSKLIMRYAPCSDDGYELLIDYRLQVDKSHEFVEFDKWNTKRDLLELSCAESAFDIELAINVREILAAQDLTVSTSYRNFHVLTFEAFFYVNTAQLKALGGKLFNDWYDREAQGETSAVVHVMDADELSELLHAACAYTTPVVHRHNFDRVLEIARQQAIIGLLRCAESFLIDVTTIHQIRKLEYAAEYRMARLGDYVLRSFKSPLERLDCLFEYLANHDELPDQVHPDVLEMCEIYSDFVVI